MRACGKRSGRQAFRPDHSGLTARCQRTPLRHEQRFSLCRTGLNPLASFCGRSLGATHLQLGSAWEASALRFSPHPMSAAGASRAAVSVADAALSSCRISERLTKTDLQPRATKSAEQSVDLRGFQVLAAVAVETPRKGARAFATTSVGQAQKRSSRSRLDYSAQDARSLRAGRHVPQEEIRRAKDRWWRSISKDLALSLELLLKLTSWADRLVIVIDW
jgi:hypothetical protein